MSIYKEGRQPVTIEQAADTRQEIFNVVIPAENVRVVDRMVDRTRIDSTPERGLRVRIIERGGHFSVE